mgnify:FL=1
MEQTGFENILHTYRPAEIPVIRMFPGIYALRMSGGKIIDCPYPLSESILEISLPILPAIDTISFRPLTVAEHTIL